MSAETISNTQQRSGVGGAGYTTMNTNTNTTINTNTINTTNTTTTIPKIPAGMDPTYYALSLLRRHRLDACIAVSTHYLEVFRAHMRQSTHSGQFTGVDEPLWFIQTKALIAQNWFDELDVDDDGVDDVLLDGEQAIVSSAPRPGTSLQSQYLRGGTGTRQGTGTAARPISSRYGFARPGTQSNNNNNSNSNNSNNRTGTAAGVRPITSRLARIGTASLQAVPGGPHLDVRKIDLEKYARTKPMVAKLLCDYLLHVEHRPRMVLELGGAAIEQQQQQQQQLLSSASVSASVSSSLLISSQGGGGGNGNGSGGGSGIKDWWWLSRVGQANYRLGLLREAARCFKAALALQDNAAEAMRLAKVYVKMDQPLTALEVLTDASKKNPVDHHIILGMARLYEQLQDNEESYQLYQRVLQLDSSNIEAIACIAAHMFYEKQQPEIALRLYRRLLQMGVQTTELWNNLGLCCFYSSQYDIALSCLLRAVATAGDDAALADVWYNIGHVGISTGDRTLAHRAFKLAIAANPRHAEALNNIAVLQSMLPNGGQADADLAMALAVAPEQHESLYNAALLAYRAGNYEKAYNLLSQALEACPDHPPSVALQGVLRTSLTTL